MRDVTSIACGSGDLLRSSVIANNPVNKGADIYNYPGQAEFHMDNCTVSNNGASDFFALEVDTLANSIFFGPTRAG
jgi:hypothetical protein